MGIHQQTRMQAYQLREGGSRARMAILRMIAAESVRNANPHTRLQPDDWRGARHYTLGTYAGAFGTLSQGMQGRDAVWYSHAGEAFRNERDAQDIINMRHSGWFTNEHCDELAIGIVAGLSHGRFIAGYRWTSNDERVYFGEIFTDELDAARMADEHARVFAEQAREDDERQNEIARLDDAIEEKAREIEQCRADLHVAIAACRGAQRDAVTWMVAMARRKGARSDARDHIRDLRKLRDERASAEEV